MIPRVQTGNSFKGAGLYYLHDKRRDGEAVRLTDRRVAWTHTENTLHDDPEAALDEMRRTTLRQAALKRASGNRTDGRPTENTVITVSLAWAPDQDPTREHMVEAGRSYLKHMGWQGHECLMVCHQDTRHPHMHLIVNRVHPETGMTIDDAWSKTRSQQWALAYEREHGHVYCKVREARHGHVRAAEGPHLNRWEWNTWQQVSRDAAVDPEFRKALEAGEWDSLKDGQQKERSDFWKQTGQMRKELRAAIREEVRNEFKGEWRAYAQNRDRLKQEARAYDQEARRAIKHFWKLRAVDAIHQIREARAEYHDRLGETLAGERAGIIARQKERIAELAVPALAQLSKDREAAYDLVKARHRAEKATLRADQAQGTRRPDLLSAHDPANQNDQPALSPSEAAAHIAAARQQVQLKHAFDGARAEVTRPEHPASLTPEQQQAYAAQTGEEQKEVARPAERAAPANDIRPGSPVQEVTDRKAAEKPVELSDKKVEQNSREAKRRAFYDALVENWGAARERGDDGGGRER